MIIQMKSIGFMRTIWLNLRHDFYRRIPRLTPCRGPARAADDLL